MRALLAMIGAMAFFALLLGGTGGGQPSPVGSAGEGLPPVVNPDSPSVDAAPPSDAPPVTASAWPRGPSAAPAPPTPTVIQQPPPPQQVPPATVSAPPPAVEASAWARPDSAQAQGEDVAPSGPADPQTGGWGAPMVDPQPSR